MNPNDLRKNTKGGKVSSTKKDHQQVERVTKETEKKIEKFITSFLEENPAGCQWLTEEQALFLIQTRTQLKTYAARIALLQLKQRGKEILKRDFFGSSKRRESK
jgi:Holliday junction resolvase-like predicted endonuclease